MKKEGFFITNPAKSANKVTINSFMMGSLFFILTLIITLDPDRFSHLVIYQLVLAIPLLYVSSLAYSKIGYWRNIEGWDALGWFTNNTGNLFVINAIGLVAANFSLGLAYAYFALFAILMVSYTSLNVYYKREKMISKIFKLVYLLIIIFFGGILPIL